MADRRMLSKKIISSDAFMDMGLCAQALYLHLSMEADDEGFINNPRRIQRMVGCNDDDLSLLIVKRFIIPFESGVMVIKHWRMNNYMRPDRFKKTVHQDERDLLIIKDNGAYSVAKKIDNNQCDIQTVNQFPTNCLPDDNQNPTNWKPNTEHDMTVHDHVHDNISCRASHDETPLKPDPVNSKPKKEYPYSEIIDYLNQKLGTQYKPSAKKTQQLIRTRIDEDKHTLEDFKRCIDNMCSLWLNDKKMCQYLRPNTLFDNKMDSYVNVNALSDDKKSKLKEIYNVENW